MERRIHLEAQKGRQIGPYRVATTMYYNGDWSSWSAASKSPTPGTMEATQQALSKSLSNQIELLSTTLFSRVSFQGLP